MNTILRFLPASFIQAVGRLQFKYPFLKKTINYIAQRLAGSGTIQRGEGKGLYFNSQGCNPGYLTGTSDPLEQELVARYAAQGSIVYDLGANAGFYAVIAARCVGPEGTVFAFEPAPMLIERIKHNASHNKQENLIVVESAVSDIDGDIQFGIVTPLSSTNSITAGAKGGISVKSLRLDSFVKNHPAADLLLIDIEGAEIDALRGGMQMLRENLPVIMVEVHWLGERFTNFFESELQPLGYTATTYDGLPLPTEAVRYQALLLPPAIEPEA